MKRKAFTLVELVLVIVIMGVVAVIGTDVITKIYASYVRSYSINRLDTETSNVLNQIVKRLRYRIKDSLIASKPGSYKSLDDPTIDNTYKILQWIGYDNESFRGEYNSTKNYSLPGWSALADLDSAQTNKTQIKTPGSRLSVAEGIIYALSYGDVNLSSSSSPSAAIIFKGFDHMDKTQFGWSGSGDHNYTLNVQRVGEDILKFTDSTQAAASKEIYERYALSWSAYAIVPVLTPGTTDDMNLTLYYDFRPWDGETYTQGKSSVLAEHVSAFRFKQVGQTLRVKLCIHDDSTGYDYAICKERAIF
ncbi:MAG: type II secretion system protein [Epsilonproteobacteria bacterium]|nr:type II secretion system protein [Campylobacterota bacterium]